jgi:hypothetical protein
MFFKGNSAKFYSVYLDPKAYETAESAIFVKEGFSLLAAIPYFTPFWFFQRKMWIEAALALLSLLIMFAGAVNGVISINILNVLLLGYGLLAGFSAIDLYNNHLLRQGHVLSAVITGRDLLEAQQRFFASYLNRGNQNNSNPDVQFAS